MAPHVLASAMAAAGAGKDSALFRDLLKASWQGSEESEDVSAKDLCSVAISLAKLRCGSESLDDFAQHFAEHGVDKLDTIDVSSLASAFSRVSCKNTAFLQRLSDRLCKDASSTLLPSVATTMALNAFAVLKHCDRGLFTVLVNNAIRPCVSDFTITQAALAVDALARCSEVPESTLNMLKEGGGSDGFSGEQEQKSWNSFEDLELNYVLAACGLRHVSMFSTPQLAMFCSNLARLPSTGREAFLGVVALRVLPQAMRSCSFVDLGLLLQAMSTCDINFTQEVVALVQSRLAEVAKEQVAHLAQHKQASEVANSVAAALERIAESSLKILSTADGKQLLASIRPVTLELFACKALRFRTAAALLLMHGHFRIRDVELFNAMGTAVDTEISPVLAGRLLRGMAPLGHPVTAVMVAIDRSFSSPSGTWQRSLPALAADLFAAALLDFTDLSEDTVNSLFQAAKVHVNTDLSISASLRLKCAGEISASSHAWLRKAQTTGDATWLADWAAEEARARDGEVLAAWPVQGFRTDLACRLPGQVLVVEVNSEQRHWAS
eukprot:Skav208468  [mRNA]  locus=scaffold1104:261906:265993:+ [translate_table: standard]